MLSELLTSLGYSQTAIRVYERLLMIESATARQLAEYFGLPRSSVYDHLKPLLAAKLIAELEEGRTKLYQANDPVYIARTLRTNIETLQEQERILEQRLPHLRRTKKTLLPRLTVYTNPKALRQVMTDMLWYENIEACFVWSFAEMLHVLGEKFIEEFNRRRLRKGISFRAITPAKPAFTFAKYAFLGIGPRHRRQVRLAPPNMEWNLGSFVYNDKVGFLSSHREAFGFIIQSKDFADLTRMQFTILWKLSKPVKPTSDESFLKTV